MDKVKLGLKIRTLRDAGGYSQRTLSAKSGVAYATLQDIEKGKGNPTVDTIEALAKTLGEPLIGLYSGRIPAEHLSPTALSGLKQETKAKRNRQAAQMLNARGKPLQPKVSPSLSTAVKFLALFESLSLERKALVSMLVYDDESYLDQIPDDARHLVALLKG